MSATISPLAPKSYPELPEVKGVRMATAAAGLKYEGRTDVLLAVFDEPAQIAGVFTKSKCTSAPVDWCKQNLSKGVARAIMVNSGNANAFTGKKGLASVQLSAAILSKATGFAADELYLASTGVIGEPLPAEKFADVADSLVTDAIADKWMDAAKAIMTTDTYPKLSTRNVKLGEVTVTLNGIAKGAGMIAPDMATMLGFLFTDAPIKAPALQSLLSECVGGSFNSITVDSDTSTSDTVLLAATGSAGDEWIEDAADPRLAEFREALSSMMLELAQMIVRDGEGATKFVEVKVEGAESDASAKRIAMAIANSPLMKTAFAGEDANWGRVVMAVGKAGERADRDRLAIWFGDIRVAVDGERDPDYSEDEASAVMKEDEIVLKVDLGIGNGSATVWTCDLTKEYVAINGDYRS
ncbi:bifunctional glutamate N-acetyltransferase/amino-acid acetyltransferase ArgJ [Pseudovibrio brasiliensis]|uniref:Arginine biosynthesis bifunctional protein ArgJ n=1 Tax=Pseudovibrio brasiliensis TaxID=1898042 RepID=A0ABX8APF8_9HYPH|nr:bifunctional glutamate N-acetyltransferase/amino-acid acetyltransferase ArgJ [Pseudovibrio brasiliensis]QUS55591.1 bifunctional glutamate N-acetyltransferase/amino-acid acetyltransferase ArgJ [Pseudovibrio brasiliensis]